MMQVIAELQGSTSAELLPTVQMTELRTLALHISSEINGLGTLYETLQTPNGVVSTCHKLDPDELPTSKCSARRDALASGTAAICEEGDTQSCRAGGDALAQALSAAGLVRSQLEALKHPHSREPHLSDHEQDQKSYMKDLRVNNRRNQPETRATDEQNQLRSSAESINDKQKDSPTQCSFCSSKDGVIVNTCQCPGRLGYAHPTCLQRFRADSEWPPDCSFCHSLYSTDCRIALSVIGGNHKQLNVASVFETPKSHPQEAPDRLSACRELLESSLTRLTVVVDRHNQPPVLSAVHKVMWYRYLELKISQQQICRETLVAMFSHWLECCVQT